ncbi:hypothetical protein EZS27_027410 [termite gut metagenome]|uniref:Uncharacterized protein n=1 Tax=termite gut metagenome TaxID=433724 RepID=A0A5J4QPM7_9ZZZZ
MSFLFKYYMCMFRNLLYSVIVLSLFACKDDPIEEVPPTEVADYSRIEAFLAKDWTIESFFSQTEYITVSWIPNPANYVVYKYTITNDYDILPSNMDRNAITLYIDPDINKGIIERYVWITQEPIDYHVDSSAKDYGEMMDFFVSKIMDKKIFKIRESLNIESDWRKNQVFLKTEQTTIENYSTYLFWKENNNFVLPNRTNGLICVKLPTGIGNATTPITEFKSDDLLFKVKTD